MPAKRKLSDADVRGIIHAIRSGENQQWMAKVYKVSQGYISRVARGLKREIHSSTFRKKD